MEIKNVNCEACGAPINVPEDVEFLNCSSCGSALAVQRGEGYVSLKMVKEVTSAIRDGTYATKSELQKLQITQEISMLEMQLNSIQGEIRGLDRDLVNGKPGINLLSQRMDLNYQAYVLIDRIRRLRINLYTLNLPDYTTNQDALQNLLQLVRTGIVALKKSNLSKPEVNAQLAAMQALEKDLGQKLTLVKAASIKAGLKSFSLIVGTNLAEETARSHYNLVRADIEKIQPLPNSPEKQAVLAELQRKQNHFYEEWRRSADTRLRSGLRSLDLGGPEGQDVITAQANLSTILNDIVYLENQEKNKIVEGYLQQLNQKQRKYNSYIQKLEKKSQPGGKGCLATLGLGALAASIAALVARGSVKESKVTAPAEVPEGLPLKAGTSAAEVVDAPRNPKKAIPVSVLVGMLIFLVFCVVGAIPMMGLQDGVQDEQNIIAAGIWLLAVSLGIAAGAGFGLWKLRDQKINRKVKAWGMFAVLLLDISIFFFAIAMIMSNQSENTSVGIVSAGICLAPSAALTALFLLLRKLPADTA